MKISDHNSEKLTDKGLRIFGNKYRYSIIKPTGIEGNYIPKWESLPIITGYNEKSEVSEEYISDCPSLSLWFVKNNWSVILHEWTPGPGPGDFNLEFENEDAAIDFILDYYFSDNIYFKEKKDYVSQNQNSIKLDELEFIFAEALKKIATCFKDTDEIDFKTFSYNKLPIEAWSDRRITTNSQYAMVKFDFGFLRNDVADLKKLIYKNRKFTTADLQKIGSVINELTRLMSEQKNCD